MSQSSSSRVLKPAGTETDFTRSVDREIIRQIGELNRRGLQVLRRALQEGQASLPPMVSELRDAWLGLDAAAEARAAEAPYLLFDLRLEPLDGAVVEPSPELETADWFHHARGRAYVRLLSHFSWQVCRGRPIAATLLLGLSPETALRLGDLDLAAVDTIADRPGEHLVLRWGDDRWFWSRRLTAAARGDARVLWQTTLAGVQRLAALSRSTLTATAS